MSKTITVLALVIGVAATYAWLQKNGETGDIKSQVEGAVNKVRDAFSNDDTVEHAAAKVRDEANDVADDIADRLEKKTA
jgi:hypothetical protein